MSHLFSQQQNPVINDFNRRIGPPGPPAGFSDGPSFPPASGIPFPPGGGGAGAVGMNQQQQQKLSNAGFAQNFPGLPSSQANAGPIGSFQQAVRPT